MKKAIVAVPYLSGNGGTETVIKNFYDAVRPGHRHVRLPGHVRRGGHEALPHKGSDPV